MKLIIWSQITIMEPLPSSKKDEKSFIYINYTISLIYTSKGLDPEL